LRNAEFGFFGLSEKAVVTSLGGLPCYFDSKLIAAVVTAAECRCKGTQKPSTMNEKDKTSLEAFAEDWIQTGPLLEQIRYRELAALTEENAKQRTMALFALWKSGFNRNTSGLVEQQEGFQKLEKHLATKR
jgi:hypothetical protein